MQTLRDSNQSRDARDEAAMDGLVVSGLTELALGALTGWPMAVAVSRPQHVASSASAPAPGGGNRMWTRACSAA
jgi:hypothetical protein